MCLAYTMRTICAARAHTLREPFSEDLDYCSFVYGVVLKSNVTRIDPTLYQKWNRDTILKFGGTHDSYLVNHNVPHDKRNHFFVSREPARVSQGLKKNEKYKNGFTLSICVEKNIWRVIVTQMYACAPVISAQRKTRIKRFVSQRHKAGISWNFGWGVLVACTRDHYVIF